MNANLTPDATECKFTAMFSAIFRPRLASFVCHRSVFDRYFSVVPCERDVNSADGRRKILSDNHGKVENAYLFVFRRVYRWKESVSCCETMTHVFQRRDSQGRERQSEGETISMHETYFISTNRSNTNTRA